MAWNDGVQNEIEAGDWLDMQIAKICGVGAIGFKPSTNTDDALLAAKLSRLWYSYSEGQVVLYCYDGMWRVSRFYNDARGRFEQEPVSLSRKSAALAICKAIYFLDQEARKAC